MTANSECHSKVFVTAPKDHLQTTDVSISVSSELSQPMGKTEFSSTTKNRTKLCLIGKKVQEANQERC